MSKCHKNRRGKKRRRRDYEDSLQRKYALLERNWMRMYTELQTKEAKSFNKAREEKERADKLEAVCESILRNKLTIYVSKNRVERRFELGALYEQKEENCYITAFKDYAKMYASYPPPNPSPREQIIRLHPFRVGADTSVSYYHSTSDQQMLMGLIIPCLKVLGERIAHMVFAKVLENK